MNDEYTFPLENKSFVGKSRRRFIKGTGTLVALGSLPAYLSADTVALRSTLDVLKKRQGIVLYKESELHSLAFADTLSQAGLKPVVLTDDLVRQWRDGLGQLIEKTRQPILGIGNWADYLVINGLAAEQRRHVLVELQHPVEQVGKQNWASTLALDYLHMPENANRKTVQAHFESSDGKEKIQPGTRTVFSWLIA